MLNKKRTYDQITKASSTETAPGGHEISPVVHVSNYFKKLKRARDDENESSDQEVPFAEVEENWMVKRDDTRY